MGEGIRQQSLILISEQIKSCELCTGFRGLTCIVQHLNKHDLLQIAIDHQLLLSRLLGTYPEKLHRRPAKTSGKRKR